MLFNKDTFFPDVRVKSSYLHDIRRESPDKVMEGDSGWVLQGVLSRASLRPLSGQKTFTVLSLHIINIYAKKRGIGKNLVLSVRAVMLGEQVDLVAGDLNGAAWRCDNRNNISTLLTAPCRCLPAPHRCEDLEEFQVNGRTLAHSSTLLILIDYGKFVSMAHSPFSMKLLVSARLTRVATKPNSTSTFSVGATNSRRNTIEGSH